ncbi:delta-60 repeat domain-containing protein [Hymenobacter glaciei]|uniref:Delta-60 repeat domain-containing protein n=1 Tax=Hymenobacter glaciei TaxID=877209 RepID=A0ABP7TVL0_9BACT
MQYFSTRYFSLCAFLVWLAAAPLRAQTLDPSFQPTVLKTPLQAGLQLSVNTLAVQPDGKVLVAGGIDFVNGALTGKLQRLNTDGTTDATFNPGGTGANGFIAAMLLQPDGKILVAGGFTTFNNLPRALLVRLNANGSLDPSFTFAPTPTDYRQLTALALQPDGKILVGSGLTFTTQSSGGVVRLNSDGSADPTFNVGTGITAGLARTLLVQADGKILVGGTFAMFNGQAVGNLVRLNATGTVDASFNINSSTTPGANSGGVVRALAQQPDGKLLVGGGFTTFDGQPAVNLTRLLLNGTADPAFQPNTNATAGSGSIASIEVEANGGLLIGGTFTQYNGVARSRVARLDALGSLDPNFALGTGPNVAINDVALTPAGRVLVGGGFTQYDGQPYGGVARLNATGQVDPGFMALIEVRGTVNQAVPLANGQLLVAGNFTQFNGQTLAGSTSSIRRVNPDGTIDASFAPPTPTGTIQAVQPNGSFYVLGAGPSGSTVTRLLASGALDNAFMAQAFGGVTGSANSTYFLNGAVGLANGQLLVFGLFGRYGTLTGLSGLVRLNADGTPDNSFVPNGLPSNGRVGTVAVQPGGKLIVVSNDIMTGATTVVRLNANGTADNTFSVGTAAGAGGSYFVLVQPDGRLLVSGGFSSFNGQAAPYGLTRLTVDGAPDPAFSSLAGSYSLRQVQPDGRILVFSSTSPATNASNQLLRLNTDGSVDNAFVPIAIPTSIFTGDDVVLGVVLQPTDGKIVLYGSFRYVGGQPRIGLARLTNVELATRAAMAIRPLGLYPNPAQGGVTIELPAAATARPATLLDLNGRLVRRWTVPARQATARLALDAVPAGVYLLQVHGDDGFYQQKVVVAP